MDDNNKIFEELRQEFLDSLSEKQTFQFGVIEGNWMGRVFQAKQQRQNKQHKKQNG